MSQPGKGVSFSVCGDVWGNRGVWGGKRTDAPAGGIEVLAR